jgi:5-oxoprolinase (ATP-hydrolysing) subunit A
LIEKEAAAVAQALRLARSGAVRTLCVHGDGPEAVRLLGAVRAALAADGFSFSAPTG